MPDIEDQIRRAREDGLFNNLRGKGKPLRLDQNPHEDPDWSLAYQMLRSSGYSLPWIEELREIEADLEEAHIALKNCWARLKTSLDEGALHGHEHQEWERAQAIFREDVKHLNQRIGDYNLRVPYERFQRRMIKTEDEIIALAEDQS